MWSLMDVESVLTCLFQIEHRSNLSSQHGLIRCIPFKYRDYGESIAVQSERAVEVLMINSTGGPGLVFPKKRFLSIMASDVMIPHGCSACVNDGFDSNTEEMTCMGLILHLIGAMITF
ncbi:unnamed protein product [Ilex paraguariensis]|uniref:Uncharacterized protein n=1 Tax=Ilex paraguariensis TaxID=185542 RepID=A0ABC8SCH0_9AQUA